jgi:hypothetical protein
MADLNKLLLLQCDKSMLVRVVKNLYQMFQTDYIDDEEPIAESHEVVKSSFVKNC